MPSLQQVLSRSLTQSLGLSDIVAKRNREALQVGDVERQRGLKDQVAVQKEGRLGAVSEQKRLDAHREKKANKNSLFNTLFTIIGAAGGFAVGGLQGAAIGSQLGGSLTGGEQSDISRTIQTGTKLGSDLESLGKTQAADAAKTALDTRKTEADISLTEAKTQDLLNPKEASLSELDKKVLDVQATGKGILASDLDEAELKNLPDNAFFNIGTGENQIKFVKNPKQLQPEAAAKLAGAQEGAIGINSLIAGIDSGEMSLNNFRKAAIPGAKRAGPQVQEIASKLDFNKEVLARIFSGAAVPDTEQVNFQHIFSIEPLDTTSVIKQKLQRNIDMVDRIQKAVLYGASFSNGILEKSVATKIIKDVLRENSGEKNVIKFDSQGKRVN